jgi:hypothetical protein
MALEFLYDDTSFHYTQYYHKLLSFQNNNLDCIGLNIHPVLYISKYKLLFIKILIFLGSAFKKFKIFFFSLAFNKNSPKASQKSYFFFSANIFSFILPV